MKNEALQKLSDRAELVDANGVVSLVAQGAAMQQIKTPFVTAMAVQRPRDKHDVLRRVVEECEIDPDGLLYRWTANNKDGTKGVIEGPSIKLAMTLAREYGNCAAYADLDADEGTHWRFSGHFVDLETGFTCTRSFRQRKPTSAKGRMDLDRTEDLTYQIGQSKAIRNAVVNGMSAAILRKSIEAAKGHIARDLVKGGAAKAVDKVSRAFGKWQITTTQLETKVGKPSKEWTPEDLAELRAIYSAIEEGQTTAQNEFEPRTESILDERTGEVIDRNGNGQ